MLCNLRSHICTRFGRYLHSKAPSRIIKDCNRFYHYLLFAKQGIVHEPQLDIEESQSITCTSGASILEFNPQF